MVSGGTPPGSKGLDRATNTFLDAVKRLRMNGVIPQFSPGVHPDFHWGAGGAETEGVQSCAA